MSNSQRRLRRRRARVAQVALEYAPPPPSDEDGLPAWTPFEEADIVRSPTDSAYAYSRHLIEERGARVWMNSRYIVWATPCGEGPYAGSLHLSIKNRDRSARHDWRDFQRIKNEVCGDEREAIEVYPPESQLLDTADQYHLWVLPEGQVGPYGFREGRCVSEVSPPGAGSQRPWTDEARPSDLVDNPDEVLAEKRARGEDPCDTSS